MDFNFTRRLRPAYERYAFAFAVLVLGVPATRALAITKPVVTITVTGPLKTYGTALAVTKSSINFKVTGLKTGDAITGLTLTPGAEGLSAKTAAGKSYAVNASLPTGSASFNAANYTIKYVSYKGIVKKAALSLTATGPLKVYGTALKAGTSTINYTATGLVNGELISSLALKPGAEGLSATTAAGKAYSVVPSAAKGSFAAANYTITYTAYKGVVSRLSMSVTATGPQKVAGTALKAGSSKINFTTAGQRTGELVTSVTLTPDAAGLSASTAAGKQYYVSPTAAIGSGGFKSSNYTISYISFSGKVKSKQAAAFTPDKSADIEISNASSAVTKPVVTITVTGPVKTYGTALAVTKSSSNFKVTGLKTGDAITSITLTPGAEGLSAKTAAGKSYAVNASLPTGSASFNAANYTIKYVSYKGIVKKAVLSVSATGPLKVYGTALKAGTSTINYTAIGLVNGELISSLALKPGAEGLSATTAAGKAYSVVPSAAKGSFAAANYTITYTAYKGVVSRLSMSVTATGPQKVAGTALTAGSSKINFITAGQRSGELVTSVTLTPDAAGLSASTAVGKQYYVSPTAAIGSGGFKSSNYTISYISFSGKVKSKQAAAFTPDKSADIEISNTGLNLQSEPVLAIKPRLTALSLNSAGLSPSFSPEVFAYTSTVSSWTKLVNLYVEAADTSVSISVNARKLEKDSKLSSVVLSDGVNTLLIELTSAAGTSKQLYSLQINKPSTNLLSQTPHVNNLLTPNGDGLNDLWTITGIGKYTNSSVTVRSLTGQVVYSKKGYTNDWNGTFKGTYLSGIYYYYVDFGNGTNAQGALTIMKN